MPLNTSDFLPGSLSGSESLVAKKAEFTRTVIFDGTPEGNEKFIARLRRGSITGTVLASSDIVRINDTSLVTPVPPTYNLAAEPTETNEGTSITITLTTIGVASGTVIPYVITGISAADLVGGTIGFGSGSLVGSFTVNAQGVGTSTINISSSDGDSGDETMTVTLTGITPTISVSVLIRDSS